MKYFKYTGASEETGIDKNSSWKFVCFAFAIAVSIVFVVISATVNTNGISSDQLLSMQSQPRFFVSKSNEIVVTTKQGCVMGTTRESRAGRSYFAFYNIPYAKPPTGELRFRPPEPPESWEGIRDGTKIGVQCIQKQKYASAPQATGEEDWLEDENLGKCRSNCFSQMDPH